MQEIPEDKRALTRTVYLSPTGRTFNQKIARELSLNDNLIFLCGHYEGIDERALEMTVTDEISIGDYVLTGGELAAMVIIDTVSRLIPGVLHNDESALTESFSDNLLEYPQFTHPEEYEGRHVPEVLLSGNHKLIDEWKREQSLIRTRKLRPDLFEKVELTKADKKFLKKYNEESISEDNVT
jgi:tRNA (guanine37-N1)-methyltransferase